jgi:hypothetical protein
MYTFTKLIHSLGLGIIGEHTITMVTVILITIIIETVCVEMEIIKISNNNNPNSGKVRYSSIEYYQSTIESEASTVAIYN